MKRNKNNNINPDKLWEYFDQKNRYQIIASKINALVGGQHNYQDVYNCYTRLRFKILNKEKVDIKSIREILEVKGIIWNNDEIQIVIGQDVYKIKDAIVIENENNIKHINDKAHFKVNKNTSKGKSILSAAVQIMVPLIPVLIGAGMLMALVSILQESKIMPYFKFINPNPSKFPAYEASKTVNGQGTWYIFNNDDKGQQPPMGWALFYIISTCSLRALSVFACVSTARYLRFNVPYSAALGIIITAPGFLLDCSGISFVLFSIPGISDDSNFKSLQHILITGQGVSIIVAVLTIFIAKMLDDWIKSWTPPSIDMSLRPFAVILTISLFSLFILTPVWYIISSIIAGFINYTKDWYGIGTALYAIVLQICITFGIHLALSATVPMNEYYTHLQQNTILYVNTNGQLGGMSGYSYFWPGTTVGSWGQLGAVIAIIILTRDRKLRRDAGSTIVTGIFGVTEPIIFGITLPKFIPWVTGTAGAALGGLFSGYMKCAQRVQSGLGIFEFFGFYKDPVPGDGDNLSAIENTLFIAIACCISLFSAIIFTLLFYKERKNEYSKIQELVKNIKMYIKLNQKLKNQKLKLSNYKLVNQLKNILSKKDKRKLKKFEREILYVSNLKYTIETINKIENQRKAKLLDKGKKLLVKNKLRKANSIMNLHSVDKIKGKINVYQKKIEELNINKIILEINEFTKAHLPKKQLNEISEITKLNNIKNLKYNFENILNSLLIEHEIQNCVPEFNISYEITNLKNQLHIKK